MPIRNENQKLLRIVAEQMKTTNYQNCTMKIRIYKT